MLAGMVVLLNGCYRWHWD